MNLHRQVFLSVYMYTHHAHTHTREFKEEFVKPLDLGVRDQRIFLDVGFHFLILP